MTSLCDCITNLHFSLPGLIGFPHNHLPLLLPAQNFFSSPLPSHLLLLSLGPDNHLPRRLQMVRLGVGLVGLLAVLLFLLLLLLPLLLFLSLPLLYHHYLFVTKTSFKSYWYLF